LPRLQTADWLEYVDWADVVVREPLKIADGMAIVRDRAGSGLEWDDAAVRRYRMD
jgi:mandelate racemase